MHILRYFFLSLLSSSFLISPLIFASTSILRATDGNPMTDLKLGLSDFDAMESSSPRKTLSCQLRQVLNVIWSRLKLLTSGMYCLSLCLSLTLTFPLFLTSLSPSLPSPSLFSSPYHQFISFSLSLFLQLLFLSFSWSVWQVYIVVEGTQKWELYIYWLMR